MKRCIYVIFFFVILRFYIITYKLIKNAFPVEEFDSLVYYSCLSAFTGFLFATLQVSKPTAINATKKAIAGPEMNGHSGIGV